MDASCKIMALFPADTLVINLTRTDDNINFEATVRYKSRTKEEFVNNWLKPYASLNDQSFRVAATTATVGKVVVYKATYRCERNTHPKSHRAKKPHPKNTDCPAVLRVTIKASNKKHRVRSKDTLRCDYPTLIAIRHNHNHEPGCVLTKKEKLRLEKMKVTKTVSGKDDNVIHNNTEVGVAPERHQTLVSHHNNMHQTLPVGHDEILPRIKEEKPNKNITSNNDDDDNYENMPYCRNEDRKTSVLDNYQIRNNVKDWQSLKNRFNSLLKCWENKNSVIHFETLERAVSYLENLESKNDDSISAAFTSRDIHSEVMHNGTSIPVETKTESETERFENDSETMKNVYCDFVYVKRKTRAYVIEEYY